MGAKGVRNTYTETVMSYERAIQECLDDLHQMRAGRVPTSWQLGQDAEILKSIRHGLEAPTLEACDAWWRATFFNAWRDERQDGELPEFIRRGLSEMLRRLHVNQEPTLF